MVPVKTYADMIGGVNRPLPVSAFDGKLYE